MMKRAIQAWAAAALLLPCQLVAAEGDAVRAELKGPDVSGTVQMRETASGAVHVTISARGVPEGAHGFHIHETGECDAGSNFKSAGGHVARGMEHGIKSDNGPHPGDLPNVYAQKDGVVHAEFFTRGFSLGTEGEQRILDDDGSAVVLHSGADDYTSQPSGDSGDRIACGVVEKVQ